MRRKKNPYPSSALLRLIEHNEGFIELKRRIAFEGSYQSIQKWARRGYAPTAQIDRLASVMPPGMTVQDLLNDALAACQKSGPGRAAAGVHAQPLPSEAAARAVPESIVPGDVVVRILAVAAFDPRVSDDAFRALARRNLQAA